MSFPAGTQIGPYRVVKQIGAGAMGEVYRAHDSRLHRDVAIKVLPPGMSADADRLRRFEQEARAVASLNHANIVAIYDVGTYEAAPYIVTELLDGKTLRAVLARGALHPRQAIGYAAQIGSGLAAAHEKGITHRDLKPENLFVTEDDRVKILDFGLAKLLEPSFETEATIARGPDTTPGLVLGTVGYMSPEQVRGQAVDHRSDIFSLGAILYEMISGERAFQGESPVETMSAILGEEPKELAAASASITPGLDRIVRHCLEKNPRQRFQSASDLAFDLEALSLGTSAKRAHLASNARFVGPAIAVIAAIAIVAAWTATRTPRMDPATFHQLTFSRGALQNARFAGDGRTIVYSAAWGSAASDVFVMQGDNPGSRPLGVPGAVLFSVSRTGELALGLGYHQVRGFITSATLARARIGEGSPREIIENVEAADWTPDGLGFAVAHLVGGATVLEYPIGTVLYRTTGWIGNPRISPDGTLVAFIDHMGIGDDGDVVVVDRAGQRRLLMGGWLSARGVSWSGREVWFDATKVGNARSLYAVTLGGAVRRLLSIGGALTLHDVDSSGRVLASRIDDRMLMTLRGPDHAEQDVSWFDWSIVRDLTEDGRTILFDESGAGAGERYGVYLRRGAAAPVRLGDGTAQALSPDGTRVAAVDVGWSGITILPTGAGEPIALPPNVPPVLINTVEWLPDGKRLVVLGGEPGHGARIFVRAIDSGNLRPLSGEEAVIQIGAVSPDGRIVPARTGARIAFYPLDGGTVQTCPGTTGGDVPLQWSADGRNLFVLDRETQQVARVDTTTGSRDLVADLADPGASPLTARAITAHVTPDGRTIAYSTWHTSSELYLIAGLRERSHRRSCHASGCWVDPVVSMGASAGDV